MNLLELQKTIDRANHAYYTVGSPIFDDTVYDDYILELKKLNPNDSRLTKVGSDIRDSMLKKQTHTIEMNSLEKATNEQEWTAWIKNTLIKNGMSENELLHASLKIDGGSLATEFKAGKMVGAITRGNSKVGESILGNAISFKGFPIKSNFSGFVRGEVALNLDDWAITDPDKTSNPRNAPLGMMRRLSGEQSEFLSFYAFRLYDSDGNIPFDTQDAMFKKMKEIGFNTVQSFTGTASEVWDWYLEIGKIRSSLNFQIDGITVFINDIKKQIKMGSSEHAPKFAVALKFEAEEVETTLLDVILQVGSTGTVAAIGKVEPVIIGGATIEFASLFNFDNINELDLAINDKVIIIRSGDIIPCITKVINRPSNRIPIITPTKCPCCGGKVEKKSNISGIDSVAIYCINEDCPAQVSGKIEKYVKSLDIQVIGTSVIEALLSSGLIKSAADLYLLKNHKRELADLILGDKVRLGEKRCNKILDNIENKRKLPLNEFLGSLGISSLGKRRVALVIENLSEMNNLDNWFSNILTEKASQSTLPNAAIEINKEIIKKKDYIMSYIKNGVEIEEAKKSNVKDGALLFCLSGPVPPAENGEKRTKEFYHSKIELSGNSWTPSYVKNVNYLVTADVESGTSKIEKAKKNGTLIINHEALLKLIGQ
jgi:DNA ligase (NAD+)